MPIQIGEPFSPYELFTGVWIPNGLVAYHGIGSAEKICLSVVYARVGNLPYWTLKLAALSEELNRPERDVLVYLDSLERDGFFRVERLNKETRYWPLPHPVFTLPGPWSQE